MPKEPVPVKPAHRRAKPVPEKEVKAKATSEATSETLPNPRGRPQIWPRHINAPAEAMALYEAIAALHNSDAFDTCHLWSGAMNGTQPVIKWQRRNKGVVQVLAGYMGVPTAKNLCGVKNCVNPFHYTPYAGPDGQFLPGLVEPEKVVIPDTGLDDYIELVQEGIDKNVLRKDEVSFDKMRGLLDVNDISDSYLRDCLIKMGY